MAKYKEKHWLNHHIEVWTSKKCNKCGWQIDPNEPSTYTWNCYGTSNNYHTWCYK